MDFKKFYLSPDGRVNRKQWWLWLVLPFTVIGTVLGFVDMSTGNYNPEAGYWPFQWYLRNPLPDPRYHRPHQALPRP